jgi:E3 ubiquitin-protein ligase RAD18
MEEMVDAFTKARSEVLEFARGPIDPGSPKRKRGLVEPVVKGSPMSKRTRSSGRAIQSKPSPVTILDSEGDEDEDYMPGTFPAPTRIT